MNAHLGVRRGKLARGRNRAKTPSRKRTGPRRNDAALEAPGAGHKRGSRKGATFVRVAVGLSALALVFSALLESFERDRPSLTAAAVVFCYMKEQWSPALVPLPRNPVFSMFV